MLKGILGFVRLDTSFGEASSRTQATDPNRRETLRIRTPLPGLRGEAKWLRRRTVRRCRATPWSAKTLTRGVPAPAAWGAPPPDGCDEGASSARSDASGGRRHSEGRRVVE